MALRPFLCHQLLQRMPHCRLSCSSFHGTVSYPTASSSLTFYLASEQPCGVAIVSELLLPVLVRHRMRWSANSVATDTTWAARSVSGSSSSGTVELKLEEKYWRVDGNESMLRQRGAVRSMHLEQPLTRWLSSQFSTKASPSAYRSSIVATGTRNMPVTPKKWKRTLPSREVLNAVYSLRRVKRNPDAIKEVLRKHIGRLLKLEMMLVLSELQRLDEWHLAHQPHRSQSAVEKLPQTEWAGHCQGQHRMGMGFSDIARKDVFNIIRKESWYRPDVYLFQTMVQVFGKNKQVKLAEKMFEDLEDEGLQPDDNIKRELLRSYVISGMMPEAIQLYKEVLKLGKDQAARSILFQRLSQEEKEELADYERTEGIDWSCGEKRR